MVLVIVRYAINVFVHRLWRRVVLHRRTGTSIVYLTSPQWVPWRFLGLLRLTQETAGTWSQEFDAWFAVMHCTSEMTPVPWPMPHQF